MERKYHIVLYTMLVTFLFSVLIFFVLTPKVFVRLPSNGSKITVALVHALLFAIVWTVMFHLVKMHHSTVEGAKAKKARKSNTSNATANQTSSKKRRQRKGKNNAKNQALATTTPAAAGTTVPGTTAPGTTVPGTTVPGTTVPGTTVPGTTAPGATPTKLAGASFLSTPTSALTTLPGATPTKLAGASFISTPTAALTTLPGATPTSKPSVISTNVLGAPLSQIPTAVLTTAPAASMCQSYNGGPNICIKNLRVSVAADGKDVVTGNYEFSSNTGANNVWHLNITDMTASTKGVILITGQNSQIPTSDGTSITPSGSYTGAFMSKLTTTNTGPYQITPVLTDSTGKNMVVNLFATPQWNSMSVSK